MFYFSDNDYIIGGTES